MTTKRCAFYTRVSTDNQAEKEFSSCEAQEQKIRSFLASQDWSVAEVYSDGGFSGANTDRPALCRLMADVKKEKIDVVLVYKIDRLTRSPKDFYQLIELFEHAKIDFISITERFDTSTPAGRLLRNIMLTFSQFERELTGERTRDKLLERAKKGMCNGGLTPYGYMRQNKKFVPHPEECDVVKSIFETYAETQSLAATQKFLREKDILNKQGNHFCKSNVGHILRNVVYAGKIKHRGEIYDGTHEPLVSDDMFALAQTFHKTKTKKFRVYKNFLFGGLIHCQACGSQMTPCFTNKRSGDKVKRYFYYRCTKTMKHGWNSCSVKQVSADRLENFCMENLERLSTDKGYAENLAFRLNNDVSIRPGVGYAPTEVCSSTSQISAENIAETLKFFVATLKSTKGVERNLLAKRCLAKINYAPDRIKLSFVLNPESINAPTDKNYAPVFLTDGNAPVLKNKNAAPFGNREFVEFFKTPELGLEPRTLSLTATCSAIELLRIMLCHLNFFY